MARSPSVISRHIVQEPLTLDFRQDELDPANALMMYVRHDKRIGSYLTASLLAPSAAQDKTRQTQQQGTNDSNGLLCNSHSTLSLRTAELTPAKTVGRHQINRLVRKAPAMGVPIVGVKKIIYDQMIATLPINDPSPAPIITLVLHITSKTYTRNSPVKVKNIPIRMLGGFNREASTRSVFFPHPISDMLSDICTTIGTNIEMSVARYNVNATALPGYRRNAQAPEKNPKKTANTRMPAVLCVARRMKVSPPDINVDGTSILYTPTCCAAQLGMTRPMAFSPFSTAIWVPTCFRDFP